MIVEKVGKVESEFLLVLEKGVFFFLCVVVLLVFFSIEVIGYVYVFIVKISENKILSFVIILYYLYVMGLIVICG